MTKNTIPVVIIALVLVVMGGWFFIQSQNKTSSDTINPSTSQTTPPLTNSSRTTTDDQSAVNQSTSSANQALVISATTVGFSPESIEIKAGETVTWVNNTSEPIQVSSDPHPTHTQYPPLNKVGVIPAGQQKSFRFDQAGTYKYHDHLHASSKGTVTVK